MNSAPGRPLKLLGYRKFHHAKPQRNRHGNPVVEGSKMLVCTGASMVKVRALWKVHSRLGHLDLWLSKVLSPDYSHIPPVSLTSSCRHTSVCGGSAAGAIKRKKEVPGRLPMKRAIHRRLGSDVCLFICRESRNKRSDLRIVRVRDWKIGIIPGFLHPPNRELESGNPTKHVSITAVQAHELLEAVEEHIGRALHEEGPQETFEVLDSVVWVLQTFSIKKPFVDCCFTF